MNYCIRRCEDGYEVVDSEGDIRDLDGIDTFLTCEDAEKAAEKTKASDLASGIVSSGDEGTRAQSEWDQHYSPSQRNADGYSHASAQAQRRVQGYAESLVNKLLEDGQFTNIFLLLHRSEKGTLSKQEATNEAAKFGGVKTKTRIVSGLRELPSSEFPDGKILKEVQIWFRFEDPQECKNFGKWVSRQHKSGAISGWSFTDDTF